MIIKLYLDFKYHGYVVVQFYSWFKFHFPFVLGYDNV